MSGFYASMAATSARLIRDKGQVVTLSSPEGGAYSPATGLTQPAAASVATRGVALAYPARAVDGTTILQGDVRLLLSPAVDPRAYKVATFDGVAHAIVAVQPLSPAGTVLLYELQVRRGGE